MRVTSKGQVTIPIDIRNRFGIQHNTEVRFVVRNGSVVLEKAPGRGLKGKPGRGDMIVARLRRSARRSGGTAMTTDELMALTRSD